VRRLVRLLRVARCVCVCVLRVLWDGEVRVRAMLAAQRKGH
jgi:hypothetical protein